MNDRDRCYSVLLVSSSARLNGSMLPLLAGSQYQQPIAVAATVAGARRALLERRFDLVLINTPMPDDFGTQLALDVCENTGSGVLLLVKAEHYPDINARVSDFGVLTVSKPTTAQIMMQSLRLLRSTRERLRRMEQKTATLERKMEEIRIVNRAKWMLIDRLHLTEQEAHRLIEKRAMDRCVTRRVIAEEILADEK